MSQPLRPFPKRDQDVPDWYLDHWDDPIFAVPKYGKSTFAGSHSHLDATTDLQIIREMQKMHPGCVWAKRTGLASIVLDVEQHEIQGKDGCVSLRRHAEELGLTESLIPYGQTPIDLSPNAGFHAHFATPGFPLPSVIILPFVELKATDASVRLPPAPGRSWDPNCPPTMPLLALSQALIDLALRPRRKFVAVAGLPEGPLDGKDFTTVGRRRVEALINRALDKATSSRELCREASLLARLCREEKISEIFARRVIERLTEEVGEFHESGFSRHGLLNRMMTTFERRPRHG
jgi:hypothetical protein